MEKLRKDYSELVSKVTSVENVPDSITTALNTLKGSMENVSISQMEDDLNACEGKNDNQIRIVNKYHSVMDDLEAKKNKLSKKLDDLEKKPSKELNRIVNAIINPLDKTDTKLNNPQDNNQQDPSKGLDMTNM